MSAVPARIVLALTIACSSSSTKADEQCLQWSAFPGSVPQIDGEVRTMLVHDDGTGPALYVAGNLVAPGSTARIGIRRWNGASFSDVGAGIDGVVEALATFDDGSGPALYAGGTFTGEDLVRWDGTSWQPVPGFSGVVHALTVFDDGGGPALYVGGSLAGAWGIVSWRFGAWSSLGTGVASTQTQPGVVKALTVGDDGSGPALYVGGSFVQAGPYAALNVARWSAGAWSSLGPGIPSQVEELAAIDDGGGPAIFCGGAFYLGGTSHSVARWNGSAWTGIRPGSLTQTLAVLDDGGGPRLCRTANICSPAAIERWNGSIWTPIGPALECSGSPNILALATFDEGSGPALFLGGGTLAIGPIRCSFARRDGTEWVRVGPPLQGPDATVFDLHVHDDGTGGVLIAAGNFRIADDQPAEGIAAWNGTGWDSLGFPSGYDYPMYALASYDAGLGNELYVGGERSTLYRRRGTTWEFVGGSTLDPSDQIRALAVLDSGSGPELYVAGSFSWFGGVPAANIVRWDGATWRVLGTQVNGVDGAVRALQVFDDGTGPVLYVGGSFLSAGGATATRIARWDGAAWSSTPLGFAQAVNAFAVHDEGAGPRLFAGTSWPVARVWRLNGGAWQAVGGNFNSDVLALASFDDGVSRALYAGGSFWGTSPLTLRGIARWNGSAWTSVGSGFASGSFAGGVGALVAFEAAPGAGPELAAGGSFTTVGAQPARNFTTWHGCADRISTFCFGDGTVAPCPCSNQGARSRGCENSQGTGGAALTATGSSAPDSIALHGSGMSSGATTLVFQGNLLQSAPTRFGDGLRCVGGQLLRLYTVAAVQGAFAVPGPGQPSISTRAAALGDVLQPGATRGYQAWYRDSDPAFCAAPSGDSWNLSNGVRIVW